MRVDKEPANVEERSVAREVVRGNARAASSLTMKGSEVLSDVKSVHAKETDVKVRLSRQRPVA